MTRRSNPLRFGVLYDFRNRLGGAQGLPTPELYAGTLEQIRRVDALGYDHVWLSEHHFVEDGYLPSLLPMSGAIAAATRRVMISQDILIVPFWHPLRLAEDLAVLDNLSGGRMMLGAGMGYVHHEFQALGIDRRERVARFEEALEICRRAWSEDRFSFSGQHFGFDDVAVRPRPVQEGGPPLWIAAMSEPGALRAARFGAHLLPQGERAAVLDPWLRAVEAAGRDPRDFRVGLVRGFRVADDPARAQAEFRASAAATAEREAGRLYGKWMSESGDKMSLGFRPGTSDVIPQNLFFGTADECADEIERLSHEYYLTDFILRGVSPGQPAEETTDSLERFAEEVIPRFR